MKNDSVFRLVEDVREALAAGRFDRDMYEQALDRATDLDARAPTFRYIHEAAQRAGLIKSLFDVVKVNPTLRWDPATKKLVPLAPR